LTVRFEIGTGGNSGEFHFIIVNIVQLDSATSTFTKKTNLVLEGCNGQSVFKNGLLTDFLHLRSEVVDRRGTLRLFDIAVIPVTHCPFSARSLTASSLTAGYIDIAGRSKTDLTLY